MKLMIASDLHGSARYSELLLHRFRQEGAERLLLLRNLALRVFRATDQACSCSCRAGVSRSGRT